MSAMTESNSRSYVYLAHRAALVEYATPILGSRETAEDIVQEAFFKFVPASALANVPSQPVAYLYRIVRNLSFDFLRRRTFESRQHTEDAPHWAMPRAEPSPEQKALFCDEIRAVTAALAEMPMETRIAVEMHRFGGYNLEDIATHLGVSVATVHRMIRNAMVELAKQVGREQE
jgi:RNA polymerase sigma-70 factor (ECF subfamily)